MIRLSRTAVPCRLSHSLFTCLSSLSSSFSFFPPLIEQRRAPYLCPPAVICKTSSYAQSVCINAYTFRVLTGSILIALGYRIMPLHFASHLALSHVPLRPILKLYIVLVKSHYVFFNDATSIRFVFFLFSIERISPCSDYILLLPRRILLRNEIGVESWRLWGLLYSIRVI